MVVFGSFLIVFFLFEEAEMLSALDLTSFAILSFGDSVFESWWHIYIYKSIIIILYAYISIEGFNKMINPIIYNKAHNNN